MGKILVLTEKPSVARDIARVLGCKQNADGCIIGPKYIVTWALGHLVTLADPEAYDGKYKTWRLEDLPMLPKKMQLVVIKETSKQFKAVAALMKRSDVDELVIATDAGREGELVARWIMIKAGWRGVTKRLWVSSQTDAAIKSGFQNLKPAKDYDNLFYSASARSEADWLVGLNVTRALTCRHNAQLAAGRVQTPTLALIVRREEEIAKFKPKDYFTVMADFGGFTATYKDSKNQSRFFEREQAEAIAKSAGGKKAALTEVKKEYKNQPPPAAYDLTELQRDANKKYAYSAKQTLSLMQSLYETHKLLTYPRTDSRYITDDVAPTLPDRLKAVSVGPYKEFAQKILRAKPIPTKYIVNNSKVSDHHAIIPTEQFVNLLSLSHEERNIYDLVVRRFLAVLSPAFEYEEVKVKIAVDKNHFYAKGHTVRSAGWKELYGVSASDDEDDDPDTRSQNLPEMRQGAVMHVKDCRVISGKTKPPARYTEATLLTAMEKPFGQVDDEKLRSVLETTSGLGTPATRADIIEKLFDSFCIERKGKELHPTSKGKQLVSIVPVDLKSAELTAKWEQRLQQIAKGAERSDRFTEEMREYAASLVRSVVASEAKFTHDNVTRDKCPDCGKYLLDVNGKKGRMLVCPDRDCGYRKSVAIVTNARCPNCHKKLEMRGEDDKKIFSCVCGYRERVSDFDKRRDTAGAGKRDVEKYLQSQRAQTAGGNAFAEALARAQDEKTN
ncbi:MAG: DNA topoisomerase III [Oscillospiraceae bacterium]|nr:DNA topoisomerase III [Oscillospiraceae bacterium]